MRVEEGEGGSESEGEGEGEGEGVRDRAMVPRWEGMLLGVTSPSSFSNRCNWETSREDDDVTPLRTIGESRA